MLRFVLFLFLIPLFTVQLGFIGDSQAGEPLFQEDFDNRDGTSFAASALNHKHIELAEGAGPDGSDAIRVAYAGYERGSQRVVLRYPLSKVTNQATLSFHVRFDRGFQWVRGGKLHGLGPDRHITGGRKRVPEGWSARMMFKADGRISTYLYDQDTTKKWGIGDVSESPVFQAGEWHHVLFQVSLNTPGQADGFARIFIDGKKVVTTENVLFRGSGGAGTSIRKFLFSTFHGGSNPTWTPVDAQGGPTTVYAYFDNFLVVDGIH
ncbi:MAG: hypothetical protein GF372_00270 [Candidatus Marinimicrobia bacterium]|nr:hypothetical protein [Candidatus Neomarinimicrobiota bacterium]